jgi:hypothetical protein
LKKVEVAEHLEPEKTSDRGAAARASKLLTNVNVHAAKLLAKANIQAAIRAGYSAVLAEVQGSRLLGKVRVAERICALQKERLLPTATSTLKRLLRLRNLPESWRSRKSRQEAHRASRRTRRGQSPARLPEALRRAQSPDPGGGGCSARKCGEQAPQPQAQPVAALEVHRDSSDPRSPPHVDPHDVEVMVEGPYRYL